MTLSPIQFNDTQKKLLYIVYGLFITNLLFGGLTVIVGAILLYVKRNELSEYQDHYQYLLRTFWGYLILTLVGLILMFIGIGAIILFAISIWFIFRSIYGCWKLYENKGVTPTGWFI